MTNYCKKLFLAICAFFLCTATLFSKTIHDAGYRFNIDIPDSCHTQFDMDFPHPYLTAFSPECVIMVDVFPIQGEQVYSYRKTILNDSLIDKTREYLYLEPQEPWYNLLRNSRTFVEESDDGLILCQRFIFRAKTLLWIRISCEKDDFDNALAIQNSFNPNCTITSYYKILKSNLRWFQGTFYLTMIPLLGLYTSKQRKKWLSSGRTDIKAKRWSYCSILISVMLICIMIFCLKDCALLGAIIALISVGVWAVFFFGQRFCMNFFNGLFS